MDTSDVFALMCDLGFFCLFGFFSSKFRIRSVLECESVIKGLYGMLGLEYRDTDSEEEGEGEERGEEGKPVENAFYITDDFTNDEDNCDANGNDDDGDDYDVIDLGGEDLFMYI